MTAAGIGQATGGGGDSNNLMTFVIGAFFIALGWSCALIYFLPIKKGKNTSQTSGRNKKPSGSPNG